MRFESTHSASVGRLLAVFVFASTCIWPIARTYAKAQLVPVKIHVADGTGKPVRSVNISIEPVTKGVTNAEGDFEKQINLDPEKTYTLKVDAPQGFDAQADRKWGPSFFKDNFKSDTLYIPITLVRSDGEGAGNGARFVSQTAPVSPAIAGRELLVVVNMKNIGTTTWTRDAYILSSFPDNNSAWGLNRVDLPHDVPPDTTVKIPFTVTAPSSVGQYSFQWSMLQNGVGYFGDATTPNVLVSVKEDVSTSWYQPAYTIIGFLWRYLIFVLLLAVIGLMVFSWRRGYLEPIINRLEGLFGGDKTVSAIIEPNSKVAIAIMNIEAEQQEMTRILSDIRELLRTKPPAASQGQGMTTGQNAAVVVRPEQRPPQQPQRNARAGIGVGSFHDNAKSYYKALVNGGVVSPDPIYMMAETKPTSIDSVIGSDSDVYLEEVYGPDGIFVLVKDSNDDGLVFPNPALVFKPSMKCVFPNLSEEMFNRFKETIEPARVSRVSDGRWRVG